MGSSTRGISIMGSSTRWSSSMMSTTRGTDTWGAALEGAVQEESVPGEVLWEALPGGKYQREQC